MDDQQIRVLLVEDNPGDARLVRAMLQDASSNELSTGTFELAHASHLREAITQLRRGGFDVILLDLSLPDSQGLATLGEIRRADAHVPVVVMSGLSDGPSALQAVHEGAQDYLVKGHVDEYALARAIRYAIERSQAQRKIVHLNQVLLAIRNVNQLIVRERRRDRLIEEACGLLVSARGFDGAWIALVDKTGTPSLTAHAGLPDDALDVLVGRIGDGDLPECMRLIASVGSPVGDTPVTFDCAGCPLEPSSVDRLSLAIGLDYQGHRYGYLGVQAPSRFVSGEEEKELLLEMASDLALALHNIEIEQQRREDKRALQVWAERWQVTFDAVADSICVLDPDWTIIQCNRASSKIAGAAGQSMVGSKCYEWMHQTAEPIESCPVGRVTQTRHRETEVIREGDHWMEVTADPIFGADDRLSGVVHIVRDVTDLRQAQEVLRRYSEQLEAEIARRTEELAQAQTQLVRQERLAALGHLAASLAHELRNPLGAIRNAVYLLNMALDVPEEDVRTALEVLNLEVDVSKNIINGLIDFADASEPTYQWIDVNHAVRQAVERTPLTPHVQTELVLGEGLSLVLADPRQIGRALDCLMLNAVQAMAATGKASDSRGCLTVATRVEGSDWIAIEVRDTGEGIPAENLDAIFEPLFTTRAKGMGLGLAYVRKITQGHGGHVTVESRAGQGATFVLHLPAAHNQ